MAGRNKPNWVFFVGGPRAGVREVLSPSVSPGTVYAVHTPGTAPGMVQVHEYLVTDVYRPGGPHEAKSREVRFVRTLPVEVPAPPPTQALPMSVWAAGRGDW